MSEDPCVVAECTSSGCSTTPAVDGTACGGTTCTGLALCHAGTCVPGAPPALTETACTVEVCDDVLGIEVVPKPAGTACSNGDACDGLETCDGAGACLAGTPPTIDDDNPCTVDACDPAVGVTHAPKPAGEPACSNGDACDGVETCDGAGACVPGAPPVLDDGDVCTADSCSPITGPVHVPIPHCDPTPTQGDAPFETRASILGKLVSKSGAPLNDAIFGVYDERAEGAPRSDVEVQMASDGSFRLRLRDFPEAEPVRSPPHRLVLVIEAAGAIPARRVTYAHPGDAVDLGTIRLIERDPNVTMVGPAGGTATDSRNRIQVVVPAGALTTTIPLQITPFDEREDFPAPLPDVTLTNYGMELEPTGTTFSSPVTVRVANTQNLPTTVTIPTGFFDEVEGRWEHLAAATWDGARFAFQTTHFTTIDCNLGMVGDLILVESRTPNPNRTKSVCNVGSGWRSGGGSLEQNIALPSVLAAGEDLGLTLHYDSSLAGSRKLGPAPQAHGAAVPIGSLAVSVSSAQAKVECIPRGSLSGTSTSPGSCSSIIVGTCGTGGVTIRGRLGLLASEQANLVSTPTNATEVALSGGWVDVPLTSGGSTSSAALSQTGLVSQSVAISGGSASACVGSGGTFAVSDALASRVQVNAPSGPLMQLTRKVLLHHRFTSSFGSGWALREISRLYADGDYAVLVGGDGQEEEFRPRARIDVDGLSDLTADAAFARDDVTGETFIVERPGGTISRFDPASGVRTPVVAGLGLSDTSFHGLAIAYVGGARRFVIAHQTGLYDVQPGGGVRQLVPRTGPTDPYRHLSVAARGSDVFYTTGDTDTDAPVLYRFDLSEPTPTRTALSRLDGDIRLDPASPLSGVTFGALKGLAFAADGALYAADSRRNVVYRIRPDSDGRIRGSSRVEVALGDGAGRHLTVAGARHPARVFSLNQPSALGAAEDGTLHVVIPVGIVSFDPEAKEAELLFLDGGRDEVMPSIGTSGAPALLSLTKSALVARSPEGLIRVTVDLLSSETEPTRTITRLPSGGFTLVDTLRAITQTFDVAGRLVEQRHRTGELQFSVAYADSRSDRVTHVANAAGGRFVFGYADGKVQTITDPAGATTTLTINAQGDLVQIVEPDSETITLGYERHKMVSKTSPRGEVTTYAYADDGTLASSHKPGGESYSFHASLAEPRAYLPSGRLASHVGSYTDARGVQHELRTNEHGAIERETYTADGVSYVEEATYPTILQGRDEHFRTRRQNRIRRISAWLLNGAPMTVSNEFDTLGRVTRQHRTSTGRSWDQRWRYDAAGWLRMESSWALTTPTAQWFERDPAGHVTRIYDAPRESGGNLPTGRQQELTWRPDGQLATATVHDVTTTFAYDDAGGSRNLISANDSLGRTRTFTRDARGNVTATSDGTASASFTFDASNRLLAARDALGLETTLRYSHESCGCTEEDLVTGVHTPDLPEGVEWTLSYGVQGRLASVTDPQGSTESYTYTATGELASVTDRLNRTTTTSYDQLGRVLSTLDAAGRSHRRTYSVPSGGTWTGPTLTAASADGTAAATTLTSPVRSGDYQIGVNALDVEGLPPRISVYRDATFELGYTQQFDDVGRLTQRYDRTDLPLDSTEITRLPTPGESRVADHQILYDVRTVASLPRIIESNVPPNASESGTATYNVELDADRVAGFSGGIESAATQVFTRDVGGRITGIANRFSQSVISGPTLVPYSQAYAYRPDGRLASVENADGAFVQYAPLANNLQVTLGRHDFTYDSRGLLATQAAFEGTYGYAYDEVGRNTRIEYPDGHLRVQLYDDLGRLTSRCYVYPDGAAADRCYTAQYDAVGNPVRTTDPEGADQYQYDGLDRLTKVTREESGASVGVEDYAYNALGALRVNAGVPLDHERPRLGGGGVAPAAVPATLGGEPVSLDAGGRVTSVKGNDFGWSQSGYLRTAPGVRYGVDFFGRRAWAAGPGHFYQYEGAHRTAQLELAAGMVPPGRVRASFLFDGIDHPLRIASTSLFDVGGSSGPSVYQQMPVLLAYYELDVLGNVRRLRAPGGQDLGGYRYTAFGQTLEANVTNQDIVKASYFDLSAQPLRWKGRPYENIGGLELYDMRARVWAPELGSFLSIDEYAFHSTRTTLWGWPGQNPIRWRDPSGHYAQGFAPFLTGPLGPGGVVGTELGGALVGTAGAFGVFALSAGAIITAATLDIMTQLDEFEHPTVTHGSPDS
ncbi:MAG: hypothetical protein KIS87_13710, partial [Phycisphaeraceae bacterium]|nr:hypothetical protein [Phycisphaeraceae bacterium]